MQIVQRAPNSLKTLWALGADRAFFVAVVVLSLLIADVIASIIVGAHSGMPSGL